MPKSTEKSAAASIPDAPTEPAAQPLAIETVADAPRIGLAARVATAAEAAISERGNAGAALHAADQRLQELLLVLGQAIEATIGELRDDLVALRDLLI